MESRRELNTLDQIGLADRVRANDDRQIADVGQGERLVGSEIPVFDAANGEAHGCPPRKRATRAPA